MDAITLRAHFDGHSICLDEPFEMELDTELIVTVFPNQSSKAERAAWFKLSQQGLAVAYGDDELDYLLDQIKEPNPEYEGG